MTEREATQDVGVIEVQQRARAAIDRSALESEYVRTLLLRRIAHDIVSPAGVVAGALVELESALLDAQPGDPMMAMARRAFVRLQRLARQLTLCAELEGGAPNVELAVRDLRDILDRAIDEACVIDGRRHIGVTRALPEEPVPVRADMRWLGSALAEVIGNAVRHARASVRVSLQNVVRDASIRVEDDGPGFRGPPIEMLDRFRRRIGVEGLGIALSMASDAVRLHGGRLEFEESLLPPRRPRDRAGAAVTVTIPLAAWSVEASNPTEMCYELAEGPLP